MCTRWILHRRCCTGQPHLNNKQNTWQLNHINKFSKVSALFSELFHNDFSSHQNTLHLFALKGFTSNVCTAHICDSITNVIEGPHKWYNTQPSRSIYTAQVSRVNSSAYIYTTVSYWSRFLCTLQNKIVSLHHIQIVSYNKHCSNSKLLIYYHCAKKPLSMR